MQTGGFIIQRHQNERRDLEAELLRTVCSDVEIEPVLQDLTREELNMGANSAPGARLNIQGIFKRSCPFPSRPYPTYLRILEAIFFFSNYLILKGRSGYCAESAKVDY